MHRILLLAPLVAVACAGSPPAVDVRPVGSAPAAPPASADGAATADRTVRYSFLSMDKVAGGSVVTLHGGGASRDATFEFNDRGRGPKEDTHYETAADGTFTRIDVTGVDYLKQPVDERFRVERGRASWKNGSEKGDAPQGAPALYVTLAGAPDLAAAMARALLAAPSHELPLLPAGRARIARVGDATVEASGQTRHVTRYDIEGLDFEPTALWLDDDGELFANASAWASVVREGWEAVVPRLVKLQRDAVGERLGALAKRASHVPPNGAALAIVHARLFDVETKAVVPDATIVIKDGRFVSVGPSASAKVPANAEILDAKGKTAIPGLWDMHQHLAPLDGVLDIANGVTGARDLGNDIDELSRSKRAWDDGSEIGSRVVLAGFIDGRGPFQAPIKVFADTEAEGIADIDKYAASGCEQIKLYSSLKTELVSPLAAYAHKKGLRVSGHVPNGMTAEDAVIAGFDELQHANFLFLNFLATKADDTRTPLRFTRVAEKGASLDLASAQVLRFVKLLADHKTVVDPTLVTFERMIASRRGVVTPAFASVADRLPVQVRRGLLTGGLPIPEGMDATYEASFEQMTKLVKILFDAGVRIVAGTDDVAGFALHRELELYVHAGIPPKDVLALATIGAARVMRHEKDWGSIRPGKYADVVLIDGKPDERIEDVRRPVTVVKGGVVFTSAELYAALGVAPF